MGDVLVCNHVAYRHRDPVMHVLPCGSAPCTVSLFDVLFPIRPPDSVLHHNFGPRCWVVAERCPPAPGWYRSCSCLRRHQAICSLIANEPGRPALKPPPGIAADFWRSTMGIFNSAAKQLQMSVDADKNFAMAHARLAEAWAEQDYSGPRSTGDASGCDPCRKVPGRKSNGRTAGRAAIQMMIARDFPGSLERYQEIARRERSPDTLFDYARALERNSQTAEAIGKYREAIALQDNYPASWATRLFACPFGQARRGCEGFRKSRVAI